MSYFLAFPAHLLEELLTLLPPGERPIYAERFEPILGDLVWIRQDAENAIESAIMEADDPRALAWREDAETYAALVDRLMEWEDKAVGIHVNEQLQHAAYSLIEQQLPRQQTPG